jgi:excisionase family DNA binding protein
MKTPPLLDRTWYDLKEVAAKFGVHYSTVYDAVRAGGIPFLKLGGVYRISKDWVDSLPEKTVKEWQSQGVR